MRARNIKPSFFKNEDLAELPPETRLLFIGLWCMADKNGIVENRPKKIRAELFPYENGEFDISKNLGLLRKKNFICFLTDEQNTVQLIYIKTFKKHQSPHRNEKSLGYDDIPALREIS